MLCVSSQGAVSKDAGSFVDASVRLHSAFIGHLASDVLLYPLETILHRLVIMIVSVKCVLGWVHTIRFSANSKSTVGKGSVHIVGFKLSVGLKLGHLFRNCHRDLTWVALAKL